MDALKTIALIMLLAFLTESMVEYLLGTPVKQVPFLQAHGWVLQYLAAVVGMALAASYQVDMINLILPAVPVSTTGIILSGLVIGRGSNYAHDILTTYKSLKL